jgi:hypothetical protein
LGHIVNLPSGQDKIQGIAKGIYKDMNLGAEATATVTEGLSGLPTVFSRHLPQTDAPARLRKSW